jgi:hypothetical protein
LAGSVRAALVGTASKGTNDADCWVLHEQGGTALAELNKTFEKTFENVVDLTIDGPKAQVRLN